MAQGITTLASNYSATATMDRLEEALHSKGVTIFVRIDQKAEAAKAGLSMNPLELLVFGNPKAGTPLMQAEPLSGLDLPLKAMVWQDNEGKVWLSYNSFDYLKARFGLANGLVEPMSAIEGLLKTIVQ